MFLSNLFVETNPTQEYVWWLSVYSGTDGVISSGGFSKYQISVLVYCGPDTYQNNADVPLPTGRIFSEVFTTTDTLSRGFITVYSV